MKLTGRRLLRRVQPPAALHPVAGSMARRRVYLTRCMMIHTNRVLRLVHGVEPHNRITERLKRRKPGWLSTFLFGNPHDHEPSCLCEQCWRESFGGVAYSEFDGDFCRDCMEPLSRCRCGGPDA